MWSRIAEIFNPCEVWRTEIWWDDQFWFVHVQVRDCLRNPRYTRLWKGKRVQQKASKQKLIIVSISEYGTCCCHLRKNAYTLILFPLCNRRICVADNGSASLHMDICLYVDCWWTSRKAKCGNYTIIFSKVIWHLPKWNF